MTWYEFSILLVLSMAFIFAVSGNGSRFSESVGWVCAIIWASIAMFL